MTHRYELVALNLTAPAGTRTPPLTPGEGPGAREEPPRPGSRAQAASFVSRRRPLQGSYLAIRFRDSAERILLRSIDPIADVPTAAGTIDWLRGALGKDWLYRVGRPQPHSGPAFTLHPTSGIVLASPTFSSSDAMERAIDLLKATCATAPVVILPERGSDGRALARAQARLDGVQHGKQVRHRGDDVVRAAFV